MVSNERITSTTIPSSPPSVTDIDARIPTKIAAGVDYRRVLGRLEPRQLGQ
jgi:hypothetical protein